MNAPIAPPRSADLLSLGSFAPPELLVPSGWLEHGPFMGWLIEALAPRCFVELGAHNGYSYFTACQAVKRAALPTQCTAIDTWRGDEHAGFYDESVYNTVRRHNDAHYAVFSQLLRTTFADAAPLFADASVDLLHVDGRHFYEDVREDLGHWRSKLARNSIVLLHDTNVRERGFGVWKLFHELREQYPAFEFLHGYGLGVVAMEGIPPRLAALFDRSDDTVALLRTAYASLGCAVTQRWERMQAEAGRAEESARAAEQARVCGDLASRLEAATASLQQREAELASAIANRDDAIAVRDQALATRDEALAARDRALGARDHALRSIGSSALEFGRLRAEHRADLGRRLAEAQARADREANAAQDALARLERIERSEFWSMTAPIRLGVEVGRQVARANALRARLLVNAVVHRRPHERGVLRESVRRRLPFLAPEHLIAPAALMETSAPADGLAMHVEAVASYPSWQRRFDTPDSLALQAMAAVPVEAVVVLRVTEPDGLVRSRDALQGLVGLRLGVQLAVAPALAEDPRVAGLAASLAEAALLVARAGPWPAGTVLLLLDAGAVPRAHGPRLLVDALRVQATARLAYGDEDRLSEDGLPAAPWFKPGFDRLLAEQGALIGRMGAIRVDADDDVLAADLADAAMSAADILRRHALRLPRAAVVHVPHVLFHDIAAPAPPLPLALPALSPLPLVSILIPTRNGWHLLAPCLESLRRTDWPRERLEIVVVDNASDEAETIEGLARAEAAGEVRVLRDPRPFNYARLNNDAARLARGDLFVLLNNDTEVLDPAWLRKMAAWAMQPWAGAVGPKLLYDDGTVQHGGIVLGIQGVGAHAHVLLDATEGGYAGLATLTHEVAAVTGACLVVSRRAFEEVGGLDEAFRVAFNDVVFCLDLLARGRRNVYLAEPVMVHHESKTRGHDDNPHKIAVARAEARLAWKRHPALLRDDPSYSPNLSFEKTYDLAFAPRRRPAWAAPSDGRLTVLVLSSTHARGHGVAVVIELQVAALAARGHTVVLAGHRGPRDFDYDGREVVEIHDPRSAATFAIDVGADVVVAHTPPFFGVARWLGGFPPVLSYDYGEPPPELFPDAAARREVLADKQAGLSMSRCVLAISEAVAAESADPPDGIIPLGNGHLGRWDEAAAERRSRFRRERGWEHAFVVFNVCRFHAGERRYKGVDIYADVQAVLRVVAPEVASRTLFVLCGKGDADDVAEMRERGLEVCANVTDEEMATLYAAADLYMNFSRWEGYNLGIGQALAMGLPVIASDIPAHRAFGIDVTDDPTEAAFMVLARASSAPLAAPRVARVTEWDAPLADFVDVVEALGGVADAQICASRAAEASRSNRSSSRAT